MKLRDELLIAQALVYFVFVGAATVAAALAAHFALGHF
jgi:hypothetical protein